MTPGAGPFWAQWHNLNKLGRGHIPYTKALGLVFSDKKNFSCIPYISLCKTCVPKGGPVFGPRASTYPEGGTGGPDPPRKSQVIWVSIGNKQLDPLENVGPPPPPPPGKCWTLSGTLKNDDRFLLRTKK